MDVDIVAIKSTSLACIKAFTVKSIALMSSLENFPTYHKKMFSFQLRNMHKRVIAL